MRCCYLKHGRSGPMSQGHGKKVDKGETEEENATEEDNTEEQTKEREEGE